PEWGPGAGQTDSQKTKIYYGNFIDNCHCKLTSQPLLCLCRSRILSALRCRGFVFCCTSHLK
ncbi:hypothetical protein KR018_001464, partial [Drosophila ironensis]